MKKTFSTIETFSTFSKFSEIDLAILFQPHAITKSQIAIIIVKKVTALVEIMLIGWMKIAKNPATNVKN